MFELLDDAHRRERKAAIVRPKYAIVAMFYLMLIGVQAGILIGRRDWNLLSWLQAGFNAVVLFACCAPLFREIYRLLKENEVD